MRSSSASLPAIVLSPEEEVRALVERYRELGGLSALIDRLRRRSHDCLNALKAANMRIHALEELVGALPTELKPGSGALQMLVDIKRELQRVREELRTDREAADARDKAREKAEDERSKAADKAREPWAKAKWIAISAAIAITVGATLTGAGAYVATHWTWGSPPPAAPAPPALAPH